jgi:hypothetical protein
VWQIIMKIIYVILWLLYPLKAYNLNLSENTVYYICHTYTFSDRLLRSSFQYKPIFTFKVNLDHFEINIALTYLWACAAYYLQGLK